MTVTRDTWLNVNGVDLATPAWEATDLSELLDDAPVRGRDVLIPGTQGVLAQKRRRTVRVATLPLIVYGTHDVDGNPIADPVQGVIDHMLYLSANLGIAEQAGDGTVPAVWTLPDSSTLVADVTVLGLYGTRDVAPGVLRTTLDLSIPAPFTEGAS